MYVHIHGHTHRSASYSTGDCLYSGWDTLVMNLSISWIPKDHIGMRTCDFGKARACQTIARRQYKP